MTRPLRAKPRRTSEGTLLDAAFAEFVAAGVQRTTMDRIARRAGVSRATLYLRYSSKEEIFVAVVERVWTSVLAEAERAPDLYRTFPERLAHIVNAKLDLWVEIAAASHGMEIIDTEHDLAGVQTRRYQRRYTEIIRTLIDNDRAERGRPPGAELVPSRTVAQVIEAWVRATLLHPGSLRTRHRYVNEAVRFFTEQAAPRAPTSPGTTVLPLKAHGTGQVRLPEWS